MHLAVDAALHNFHDAHHSLHNAASPYVDMLCCAVLGQVDGKVSSKTIQRLQGQVEAREQELGALNIKVCANIQAALLARRDPKLPVVLYSRT